METVSLSQADPAAALALLAGIERLDPSGRLTAETLPAAVARGVCIEAAAEGGARMAYVLRIENGVAWVDFAQGGGAIDWTAVLAGVLQAQCPGVRRIAFQTMRPGLVRKAKRHGYTVRGWILGKDIQ